MSICFRYSILAAIGSLSLAASALAHEFWLTPTATRSKAGDLVNIQAKVGHEFPMGEVVRRNASRIEMFAGFGPGGKIEMFGKEGSEFMGQARYVVPGTYVIAYRSFPKFVEINAATFNEYLAEKGLDEIIKRRAERKETDKPGKELFSRAAKTIVQVGTQTPEKFDIRTGMRMEIIPLDDPMQARAKQPVRFKVEWEGKPAGNTLVAARMKQGKPMEVRTDAAGIATFTLPEGGRWLVDAVHMTDAPKGNPDGAEFESVWASYVFDVLNVDGTLTISKDAEIGAVSNTEPIDEAAPEPVKQRPGSDEPMPVAPPAEQKPIGK